jgi:hypothetical protein
LLHLGVIDHRGFWESACLCVGEATIPEVMAL